MLGKLMKYEFKATARLFIPMYLILLVLSSVNRVLLELTRKGSSKGGMVQYLARRLGIDAQHIYCVGDNQNDIPMLAVSAIPFAPANCAPEVKQWGARILGACEESCVAQIVDILDHIYA